MPFFSLIAIANLQHYEFRLGHTGMFLLLLSEKEVVLEFLYSTCWQIHAKEKELNDNAEMELCLWKLLAKWYLILFVDLADTEDYKYLSDESWGVIVNLAVYWKANLFLKGFLIFYIVEAVFSVLFVGG